MTIKTIKRKTSLLIAFAISLIPIATAIITLNYLGLTLDDKHDIDSKDWQRKWLIVFAWLYVISYILGLLFIRV
jgi:hypothetical protein